MLRLPAARAWFGALAWLVLVCVSQPAIADVAAAEALFREGRRLLEEGRTEEACAKLSESQRLDPSSGTLINLADCHAELGLTATAWAEFLAAGRLALAQQRPLRAEEARHRAAELEPKVPYLTVRVVRRLPGLLLTHNDARLAESAIGIAIPVDPGTHVVHAAAPGYQEWSTTLTISKEGENRIVDVPELEPAPVQKEEAAKPPPEPRPTPRPPPPMRAEPLRLQPEPAPSGRLPFGFWMAGGTSVAAAGVGSVFGILSLTSYNDAESRCAEHIGCNDDAIRAWDRSLAQANVANVAFATAAVAAVVAGWLYFTADTSDSIERQSSRQASTR